MEFVDFIRTPMVEGVTLYRPNNMPVEGTLCVTGHHLILSSRRDNKEELWVRCNSIFRHSGYFHNCHQQLIFFCDKYSKDRYNITQIPVLIYTFVQS